MKLLIGLIGLAIAYLLVRLSAGHKDSAATSILLGLAIGCFFFGGIFLLDLAVMLLGFGEYEITPWVSMALCLGMLALAFIVVFKARVYYHRKHMVAC